MTIEYKIWDFPSVPVSSQLFHISGAAFEGGFTSGGARIVSPEAGGGRAMLEMELSFQTNEWVNPLMSWLMSKINGDIFRVQLIRTPQLVSNVALGGSENITGGVRWAATGIFPQYPWDNGQPWADDGYFFDAANIALEGSQILSINMSAVGEVLKHGHVIGHADHSYMIDDIEYSETGIATITVKPALRDNVNVGDMIYTRPYFLGTIANGDEIRSSYDIQNVGHIELSRILFQEVVL